MASRHRWWIPAALVVIALVAIGAAAFFRTRPRARLTRALENGHRTASMRITGLGHAALPPVGNAQHRPANTALRLTANMIRATKTTDPHDKAVAALLVGHSSEAVRILENVVAREPSDADAWNDLAAAYCEYGEVTTNPLFDAKALAAVDRALELSPDLREALFNRAIALEKLGLLQQALGAYRAYSIVDARSAWSSEARMAIERIATQVIGPIWEEAASRWQTSTDVISEEELKRLTLRFPQQARTYAENQFLPLWADHFIERRPGEARRWLDATRVIARVLRQTSGESLLSDVIAHVDASDDDRQLRLAMANRIYREGRILYRDRKVGDALPLLLDAERRFATEDSPLRFAAAYFRANALVNLHRTQESRQILNRLNAEAPASYLALHAQLHWLRGTLAISPGLPYEALHEYRLALRGFEHLREEPFAARMRGACAGAYADLGQDVEAWRFRVEAFRGASIMNSTSFIEVTLNDTARAEISAKRFDTARSLLRVEVGLRTTTPRLRFDALLWQAFVEARFNSKPPDFNRARVAATAIDDYTLRNDAHDELRFLQAIHEKNDVVAIHLATQVIESRQSKGLLLASGLPLTERARRHYRLGHYAAAVSDFEQAIRAIDSSAQGVARTALRDTYYGTVHDAKMEFAQLLLERGRVESAFTVLDRARSRPVSRGSDPAVSAEISQVVRRMPPATTLVHYTSFANETLIVTISRSGWSAHRVRVAQAHILRIAERFETAILQDDRQAVRQEGAELYRLIIRPVEARLERSVVIVPDRVTATIAFAALTTPDGQWLVERFTLASALSATMFQAERDLTLTAGISAITNPAFDQNTFPNLPRLPASARDSIRLRQLLPRVSELSGHDATVSAVTASFGRNRAIHISAHAVVDEMDASRSIIALTPTGDDRGFLDHGTICDLDLSEISLVMLFSCRTTTHGGGRGKISSLGLAFIAAGADSVLGALTNVDDAAASALAFDFYEAALTTPRASSALRRAQMTAVDQNRPIRDWAVFQVILGH
jgi:CHAT domain-containing protein